jgi:hypothetical protein
LDFLNEHVALTGYVAFNLQGNHRITAMNKKKMFIKLGCIKLERHRRTAATVKVGRRDLTFRNCRIGPLPKTVRTVEFNRTCNMQILPPYSGIYNISL